VIVLICFSGCVTGCSWTATIGRTDGLDNDAEVDHSDADAVYLRDRNDRIHRIERASIRTIDHPGNVEMLIGAITVGLGGWAYASSNNRDEEAPGFIIMGSIGLALILWGMIRYIPSLRAAWAFQTADPPVKMVPPGVYPPPPAAYPPPLPGPAPSRQVAPPPPASPAQPQPQPQPEDEQPEVVPGAT